MSKDSKVSGKKQYINKNSGEVRVSTLGAKKFSDQVDEVLRLGVLSKISKAYDTFDINADVDDVIWDITREVGFDLADMSEMKRIIEARKKQRIKAQVEAKEKTVMENSKAVKPEIKQEASVQPAPAQ